MWSSALPLLVGLSPAVVFLLQLPDSSATQEGLWQDYKHGRQGPDSPGKKPFCSWKCLLFTLQWPGAFCQSLDKETLCEIPPSINNWTIHGLWPQKVGRCCSCWPMFQSDVQELHPELKEHWPSLLKTQSSFHFWKQEWEKHGVCAACVEGMNSPLRYFSISLQLRAQFDIHRLVCARARAHTHTHTTCQHVYLTRSKASRRLHYGLDLQASGGRRSQTVL
ncbi:ribonuclease T2-like isoform 2-T3 [Spinachia spinachia]